VASSSTTVLATSSEKITLLDLIARYLQQYEPSQELVQIIAGVTQQTTKDNQHVVDIMLTKDRVADLLAGAHGLTKGGNVCVVPGVVVDQSGAVAIPPIW